MCKFNAKDHMMVLKGNKEYLPVAWRLVWFREENPGWSIASDMVQFDCDAGHAVFRSEIRDESGRVVSTGYGSESIKDFRDYLEKAETKAVGRALAMLGYGTQFAPELDEGERIVDTPVEVHKAKPAKEVPKLICEACGHEITYIADKSGKMVSAQRIAARAQEKFGKTLCCGCAAAEAKRQEAIRKLKEGDQDG